MHLRFSANKSAGLCEKYYGASILMVLHLLLLLVFYAAHSWLRLKSYQNGQLQVHFSEWKPYRFYLKGDLYRFL